MKKEITAKELPLSGLEKLGLYSQGKLQLEPDDIRALLAGRRTDMLSLENLTLDGFSIRQLDVKLSLNRYPEGGVSLNLHPVYKEVRPHPLLNQKESDDLQSGKIDSIQKETGASDKKSKKLNIEFDEQTREFVSYDPDRVEAPQKVNGETLSDKQRKAFQKGELVELSDGTRLQHRATERKGILSDRKALILSVLLDGGISYLLLRGIQNLKGNKEEQKTELTKGYQQAFNDMKQGANDENQADKLFQHIENPTKAQQSRGYGRSSAR